MNFIGIVLIILLYTLSLQELRLKENPPPLSAHTPATPPSPREVRKNNTTSLPHRFIKKIPSKEHRMAPPTEENFDTEGFLKSFARQSQESLLPCLKSHFPKINEESQSLLIVGTLVREGQIRNIKKLTIKDNEALPECVPNEIQKMNFTRFTQAFKNDSLEIQWRLEF